MTQRAAVDKTIAALRKQKRLGPEHEALVQVTRGLAEAVDEHTDRAALWREFRAAVVSLQAVGADEEQADDGQTAILALVRPEVGDAKKPRAKNVRTPDRSSGRAPGDAAPAVAANGGRRRRGAD